MTNYNKQHFLNSPKPSMKKLTFLACALSLFAMTFSSCSSSRGCNGSWYNNRNVQVQPESTDTNATCYHVEIRENI